MKFEQPKPDLSSLNSLINSLAAAQAENYSKRLGRDCRQMGDFILRFCDDITEEERFKIEQFLRDLDNGHFD